VLRRSSTPRRAMERSSETITQATSRPIHLTAGCLAGPVSPRGWSYLWSTEGQRFTRPPGSSRVASRVHALSVPVLPYTTCYVTSRGHDGGQLSGLGLRAAGLDLVDGQPRCARGSDRHCPVDRGRWPGKAGPLYAMPGAVRGGTGRRRLAAGIGHAPGATSGAGGRDELRGDELERSLSLGSWRGGMRASRS
jgi:hypothetical protein